MYAFVLFTKFDSNKSDDKRLKAYCTKVVAKHVSTQ